MIKLLIFSLLTCTSLCSNTLEDDTKLTTQKGSFSGGNFNSITAYLNLDSNKSPIHTNLDVQINIPYVMVGNKDQVGWGIPCNASTEHPESTCIYDKVNDYYLACTGFPSLLIFC